MSFKEAYGKIELLNTAKIIFSILFLFISKRVKFNLITVNLKIKVSSNGPKYREYQTNPNLFLRSNCRIMPFSRVFEHPYFIQC